MFTDSWIYRGFMRFDLWSKKHGGQGIDRRKMHSFEFGHLRRDYLGLNIVLRSFVMQRWISMKDHTTLCLHAELWLHMQTPHYRSYRTGTRNMMLTFNSRPIYRALTYIAVPFLGPQQPRYIGLTLYNEVVSFLVPFSLLLFLCDNCLLYGICNGRWFCCDFLLGNPVSLSLCYHQIVQFREVRTIEGFWP